MLFFCLFSAFFEICGEKFNLMLQESASELYSLDWKVNQSLIKTQRHSFPEKKISKNDMQVVCSRSALPCFFFCFLDFWAHPLEIPEWKHCEKKGFCFLDLFLCSIITAFKPVSKTWQNACFFSSNRQGSVIASKKVVEPCFFNTDTVQQMQSWWSKKIFDLSLLKWPRCLVTRFIFLQNRQTKKEFFDKKWTLFSSQKCFTT